MFVIRVTDDRDGMECQEQHGMCVILTLTVDC